jgi:hypothetical protein
MSRPDLLDAIAWAAGLPVEGIPTNPYPARVINMSTAGGLPVCSADLQRLITRVVEKRCLSLPQLKTIFTNRCQNQPIAKVSFL